MSLKPSPSTDSLELTIRFSASLPDLHLSISLAEQPHANTSTLKQLIRTHLPTEHASRRIRLIYSGKALADDVPLSTSLKRSLSHPPSRTSTPHPNNGANDTPSTHKGKGPIRDALTATQRTYIHCSIGDLVLSPAELADEARVASPTSGQPTTPGQDASHTTPAEDSTTAPAPRGFDRLLTAGFTPAEVSSLRLQFLAIQAHTHTPDDMPSPTTLRTMEDQWLDNSSGTAPASTTVDGAGGNAGATVPLLSSSEESEGGALDDMLYGAAMGFFWPIGCLLWAAREEGVWSQRRRMAVVVGVVLNVGVAFVRFTG